ncbi:MAG TPA: DUF1810 domain-containing protein [Acidocella sp.]|uniref:DUF1810 domain-containing protein n=1 Tax=Acidocella sp. TaxID=50710 RepID=UPI002C22828B|nr:DUF1810 domain-containing protein [Acidocella sp.]HVE23043.1 DUF1810 domain-containing protein [Acidocella sp.]
MPRCAPPGSTTRCCPRRLDLTPLFDLERFVTAQAPVRATVQAELAAGAKRTHWMWFIFPQLAGLGTSLMSRTYAISGRTEAAAYLAHPQLGPFLLDCTRLVLAVPDKSATEIFGPVDAAKFRSCMTLFANVSEAPEFSAALQKYFAGNADPATLARL